MNTKLKRGIAVVLGIAAVGVVGAQVLSEPPVLPEQQTTAADMTSPPADMTSTPMETTTTTTTTETIVVAPEPAPVLLPVPMPVPAERVVIELPRSVSSRSGEGSGEEIAMRTAPVDERAGMSPLYQVDQSPGL